MALAALENGGATQELTALRGPIIQIRARSQSYKQFEIKGKDWGEGAPGAIVKLEVCMNWIKRLVDLFSFNFAPASTARVVRDDRRDTLNLLQDYFTSKGGIDEAIKRFEGAGFVGKVRSWTSPGSRLRINSIEALQLIGWKDLREMSGKADIPVDRLRELLAELLPVAVKAALS